MKTIKDIEHLNGQYTVASLRQRLAEELRLEQIKKQYNDCNKCGAELKFQTQTYWVEREVLETPVCPTCNTHYSLKRHSLH